MEAVRHYKKHKDESRKENKNKEKKWVPKGLGGDGCSAFGVGGIICHLVAVIEGALSCSCSW